MVAVFQCCVNGARLVHSIHSRSLKYSWTTVNVEKRKQPTRNWWNALTLFSQKLFLYVRTLFVDQVTKDTDIVLGLDRSKSNKRGTVKQDLKQRFKGLLRSTTIEKGKSKEEWKRIQLVLPGADLQCGRLGNSPIQRKIQN